MGIVATALIILVVSFILALRSMSDINFGDELEKFFQRRKIKGSIKYLLVGRHFFKNKAK
jgi:hypothetical protein